MTHGEEEAILYIRISGGVSLLYKQCLVLLEKAMFQILCPTSKLQSSKKCGTGSYKYQGAGVSYQQENSNTFFGLFSLGKKASNMVCVAGL